MPLSPYFIYILWFAVCLLFRAQIDFFSKNHRIVFIRRTIYPTLRISPRNKLVSRLWL